MVIGFKNAPMIFQRVINQVLDRLIGNGVEVYMNGIIIHFKKCDALVREVIKRLSMNKLNVNIKKVQYTRQEVKLLGVTINERDKMPNKMKKNEALEFPKPYNIMQMRRYLGLVGWFREFVQNFSVIAAPLYNALKQKGALIWNEDMN
ncbi:putative Reverse transcriptase, LTR Retrotransposon protein [Trachipleistophora hominis]|uniref:Putative Reverse transcriptase, LTR Retrotransposon protein n=1 Tax=Trachipleistophora hominis TaxID=72359 RepID=L7JRH5_TRAHO|nr:putative Reverse transcriptase, LTR Retrotransposon protein [Trachipleistophora hominis]